MNVILRKTAEKLLKQGAIGILPTDTIYGVVGLSERPDTVERIYTLKVRDSNKPFIILISDISMLKRFPVSVSPKQQTVLAELWPGPVSVILPCEQGSRDFRYLHRGLGSLAFRVPDDKKLQQLLRNTGPLVAPSANPAGKTPATSLYEAVQYFANTVDFYVDGGLQRGAPSKLIRFESDDSLVVLRP